MMMEALSNLPELKIKRSVVEQNEFFELVLAFEELFPFDCVVAHAQYIDWGYQHDLKQKS